MSRGFRDDDDEFIRRASALALLEDDGDSPVSDDVAYDELEYADQVSRRSGSGPMGLEEKTSLRDQKWQGLNQVAPWARINPASALRGVLGGQQPVTSGQRLTVANWSAADDAETLPVTVTVAPVQQQLGAAFDLALPYTIVQFGTRGFSVMLEADIARGTQFTVGCSSISVQVCMPALPATGAFSTPVTFKLAGMLSFYPVVRTVPVVRTAYGHLNPVGVVPFLFYDAATGAISTLSIIPGFAERVTVYFADPSVAYTVSVTDANGIIVYLENTIAPSSHTSTFDLPNGAFAIDVTSGGVPTKGCYITYELAV